MAGFRALSSHPDRWGRNGHRVLSPYDALLLPTTSSLLQLNLTRAYLSGLQSISHCSLAAPSSPHPLRLTYLSYDFRDHPMGHLTQGLVTSHNRSRFVVQAASYGPNDNSTYRERIEAGVQTFTDLEGQGEVQAACGGIAQWGPHILVDLMALTRGTRTGLAALCPAPLVVNYLGYPSTMASSFVDYVIVDPVVAPVETARQAFSERLVLLPHTYQANDYSPKLPLATAGNSDGTSSYNHQPVSSQPTHHCTSP